MFKNIIEWRRRMALRGMASPLARRLLIPVFAALGASACFAQGYPSKPLRFVVPFAAGSTTDQAARFIGQHITQATKQPVIVENRAGAEGIIGIQYALAQPVDGYTIVITTSTTHAANVSLFKKLPYDPVADFMPITGISQGGLVLAVAPNSPVQDVRQLIDLARAQPGKLSFGSGNSSSRAGGEMFKDLAKVDILHVPYTSVTAVLTDVIAGRIDMVFADAPAAVPMIRGGRLRALGVSTTTRMPGFDNLPTIAEQGLPGYELTGWLAAFAPKGTPPEVADRLNELIVAALKTPEAARFFGENGWRPMPTTRQELAQFQKSEILRWAKLVRTAGIEPQ